MTKVFHKIQCNTAYPVKGNGGRGGFFGTMGRWSTYTDKNLITHRNVMTRPRTFLL